MTRPNAIDIPIPENPIKRRGFIKWQLELRGLSLAEIARQQGVTRKAVSQVAGGGPSARIQQALAEALDMPVERLFPERFEFRCAAGNRHTNETTRSSPDRGVKSRQAA